jgi:type I restriction enzyme S subunit
MNVLLSIKPKYVEAIMNGEKRYEFRKTIFRNIKTKKVFMYATAPVKKVVGSFLISNIFEDEPEQLWSEFNKFSGLSETEFFNYFNEKEKGFAIEIDKVEEFAIPIDPRKSIQNFVPPQSFYYIETPLVP